MQGRYTSVFPRIFKISPIAPVIMLINIMIKINFIWWLCLALIVAEVGARAILKMPPLMAIRKITRGLVSIMFYSGLKTTPVIWNKKHWPMGLFALFMAFSMLPNSAMADYKVTDSMRWDRAWAAGSIGMNKEDIVEVVCRDCPLKVGLEMLLPKDFTVLFDESVDRKKKVNFSGGQPWGLILNDVAINNDLSIEVMRHKSRVIIENSPKNQGQVAVNNVQVVKQGFYDTKTWELIPNDTLKSSLENWVRQEGWSLIYELDTDIYIDVYASFTGNLVEAVQLALEAYKSVGVLSRVTMSYSHSNTTIKISLASGSGE